MNCFGLLKCRALAFRAYAVGICKVLSVRRGMGLRLSSGDAQTSYNLQRKLLTPSPEPTIWIFSLSFSLETPNWKHEGSRPPTVQDVLLAAYSYIPSDMNQRRVTVSELRGDLEIGLVEEPVVQSLRLEVLT